jgi:hypothetical protein
VFEALLNVDDGIPPPPPSTMNMLKTNNPTTGIVTRPFADCFKRASQNTKSNATIRGKSLRLLGKLACAYPLHMEEEATNVLQFCLDRLFKSTGSTLKESKVEFCGSLDSLRYLFEHYSHLLFHQEDEEDEENEEENEQKKKMKMQQRQQLYNVSFRESIIRLQEMTRYQIPEASLLFIASHGHLFKEQIINDGLILFRRLCRCFICKPKRIHQAAVGAAKKIINMLSSYISITTNENELNEEEEEEEKKRKTYYTTLCNYMNDLMKYGSNASFLIHEDATDGTTPMSANDVGVRSIDRKCHELAILGFGSLAGSIYKYEGVDGLTLSITRMLSMAFEEKENEESDDGEEEESYYNSSSAGGGDHDGVGGGDHDGDTKMNDGSSSSGGGGGGGSSSSSAAASAFVQRNASKYRWMKTRLLEACSHTMLHIPKNTSMKTIMNTITKLMIELLLTYHTMNRFMKNDVRGVLA